jgi:hypothetical protein
MATAMVEALASRRSARPVAQALAKQMVRAWVLWMVCESGAGMGQQLVLGQVQSLAWQLALGQEQSLA